MKVKIMSMKNLERFIFIFFFVLLFSTFGENDEKIKFEYVDMRKMENYLVTIKENISKPIHICSGTVLTDRWILSASECLFRTISNHINTTYNYTQLINPSDVYISHMLTNNGKLNPVTDILFYPSFVASNFTEDNIALIRTRYSLNVSCLFPEEHSHSKNTSDADDDHFKDTISIPSENFFNIEETNGLYGMVCQGVAWVMKENSSDSKMELKTWRVNIFRKNFNKNATAEPFKEDCVLFKDELENTKCHPGAALFCSDMQVAVRTSNHRNNSRTCNSTTDEKWTRIDQKLSWITVTHFINDDDNILLNEDEIKILEKTRSERGDRYTELQYRIQSEAQSVEIDREKPNSYMICLMSVSLFLVYGTVVGTLIALALRYKGYKCCDRRCITNAY